MSNNSNMNKAKSVKYDEFYTQLSDIENELKYYKEHFLGKVVYCNCDDPEWSNFWKYFVINFNHIGLKRLISTHYEMDGSSSYSLEYFGDKDKDGQDVFVRKELIGDGDFRSEECLALLDESDIVVTNPPFALFREYIKTLIEYNKQFLIIGNMNNVTYKDIFPYIKQGKLKLGVHSGSMDFRVPDEFDKDNTYYKDGIKYAKFGNICWYTSLDHYKQHEFLELNAEYKGNEDNYPKYDNYDAININRLDDIPNDYFGVMGVPLTILQHYNSEQFRIKGIDRYVEDNPRFGHRFKIDGKEIYARILIERM